MTVSQSHQIARSRSQRRSGLTLVEIMIALTMTLIVLGAMMSAFRYASEKMQLGRGVMEMANRLRVAEEFLRSDLANLTLDPRPHTGSANSNGFLEISEEVTNDSTVLANTTIRDGGQIGAQVGYLGDLDDTIGMTCRSPNGQKFRGSVNGGALTSTMAEIWYFTTFVESNDAFLASGELKVAGALATGIPDLEDKIRLHRRVLLIRPDRNTNIQSQIFATYGSTTLSALQVDDFISRNDISVRVTSLNTANTQFSITANSIADLAIRQNRFGHQIDNGDGTHNFPNLFLKGAVATSRLKPNGGDILLTGLAGFDVRVYSPNAPVRNTNALLVEPNDLGYVSAAGTADERSIGAYVNLGNGTSGWFAGGGTTQSQLTNTYDTWTTLYEHDGLDQDGDGLVDEGTNGLNDGGTDAFDDDGERETRPPYPFPVRGLKISTRLIEKNTQQIHQSTVVQSYVPE